MRANFFLRPYIPLLLVSVRSAGCTARFNICTGKKLEFPDRSGVLESKRHQRHYAFSVWSAAVHGSSNVSTPKYSPALKLAAPDDGPEDGRHRRGGGAATGWLQFRLGNGPSLARLRG